MKAMKSAVSLGLILYLCVSLSGVLLVLDASAKITPKETDDPTGFYYNSKGRYSLASCEEISPRSTLVAGI